MKKKIIIIVLILLLVGGYFGIKGFALSYYDVGVYNSFKDDLTIKDTMTIKKSNLTDGEYLTFKNIKVKNEFKNFKLLEQDSDLIRYGLRDDKNNLIATFFMGTLNSIVDGLRNEESLIDESKKTSNKDLVEILDKNNINNDVDLFSFLSEHKNVKNNIFTPLKEMKENYAIEYMASVVWQPNRKITIIDGDYQGYLLNEKSTNANLYEARIEYDGQLYVFIFLNKEEYFKKEDINNILNTVIFDDKINNNEVSLSIKDNTLTSKGATIVIKNNTNMEYNYGPEYYLEKQEGSKWVTIEPKEPLSWNDILYSIKSNESKEYNEDWSYAYGKLSKGKYILVKNIFLKDATTGKKETISVEFEI